jgi:hypothetical protein
MNRAGAEIGSDHSQDAFCPPDKTQIGSFADRVGKCQAGGNHQYIVIVSRDVYCPANCAVISGLCLLVSVLLLKLKGSALIILIISDRFFGNQEIRR